MRNLPVHWSEGMFLRPHHFQAADRYWNEVLTISEHWDHEYNYGLRQIDFSVDAIKNFQFQLNSCQARMKDGTLISLEQGQSGVDRLDLKGAMEELAGGRRALDLKEGFASTPVLRVYLAAPKLKLGAVNVARDGQASTQRYQAQVLPLQDESSGGNDQDIEFRSLSVRLLLSTQDLAGYEVLPIADIQRASEQDATPRLSLNYIPPLLAVDAWPPLALDIVRAIYDRVGHTIERLSEQVVSHGISLVSQEPGDLDRLMMLSQLNEAYAVLGVMAFASGVHPLVAYTELCRLVGKLSIFGPTRRVPEVPRYDHDDLARIFYWVKQQIELLLAQIPEWEYDQVFFEGTRTGMQARLQPKWLNADWKWYVGVTHENVSEKECTALLSSIDWKLGSANRVEALFKYRAEGLKLVPLGRPPRPLPMYGNWLYFEVTQQGDAWKDVRLEQTLAMRFKDEIVLNRDTLEGQRSLVLNDKEKGRKATLQFALFAVPTKK
jgi:type VI secretion system protein ImpJ